MKRHWFIVLLLFGCMACSKDDKGSDDRIAPMIGVVSPSDNQSFAAGQTIQVAMTVSDNDRLFVIHIHISDANTGQLYYDIHRYPDSPGYAVSESFVAVAGVQYKIQVIARDNTGNETIKTIQVSAV